MNPFLPPEHCIPDGEAHVFGGRCYLYGSYDLTNDSDYCSGVYRTFSADIHDLEHWTDHGISFASQGPLASVPWTKERLYAPDVTEKDGVYYLYFCTADGSEGVAFSRSPEGPFTNPTRLFYPPEIRDGAPLDRIDPAVFIDDDGSAYYYWGQFQLQGAKLSPDMMHLEASSYHPCLISEETHFFHEGSSMRKLNGKYYLLYCSIATGRANTLDYAIGDTPLGPFRRCGSLINNSSCDPESWNIHGSLEVINGELYLFYHRSSNNSRFSRRACVEKLSLRPDGTISPVSMTSLGFEISRPARSWWPALSLCERQGDCFLRQEDSMVLLKAFSGGSSALWRSLTFDGTEQAALVRMRAAANGTLTLVCTGKDKTICTSAPFTADDWFDLRIPVSSINGTFEIQLDISGDKGTPVLCEIAGFSFI